MIISDPDVTDGKRIKLLDFGIVKILSSAGSGSDKGGAGMTASRTVLGTPEFMAPEQWTATDRVDGKADVYALGVITFLCLVGRMPFAAANYLALGLLHCQTPPPGLSYLDPSIPSVLANLVASMLEKHPTNRPTMAVVDETMGRLLSLLPAPLTLPFSAEHVARDGSEVAQPDDEEPSAVSRLQTYTWEELEIGLVGPSYEDPIPGESAVQVRLLLPVPPVPVVPGVTPLQLIGPPLLLTEPPLDSPTESTDRTPPPSPFFLLQRSLMKGSHLSWPGYLLTAAVMVCVFGLLSHRPQRSGGRPAAAVREPFVLLPSLVATSVSGEAAAMVSAEAPLSSGSYRPQQSQMLRLPPETTVSQTLRAASSPPVTITARHRHKHHSRHRCPRSFPTSSCIRNHEFTLEQRMTLLRAFYLSNTKLCAYEHLVVSASPSWPSMQKVPATLSASTQASLQVALRLLFRNQPSPSSIDVRCPRKATK